jgi:hypothetical protein
MINMSMNVMYGTTNFATVVSYTGKVFMTLTIEWPFYEIVWQATQSTLKFGGLLEPPMQYQMKKTVFKLNKIN